MQRTLLDLNLLESQGVCVRVEIVQAGSIPLLVSLRVVLLQACYVLGHLLEHLGLEVALGLRRAQLELRSIGACLRRVERDIGTVAVEFPLLCGWRGFDGIVNIGSICQNPLPGLIRHASRHNCVGGLDRPGRWHRSFS